MKPALGALVIAFVTAAAANAQTLGGTPPAIHGETANGKAIELPSAAAGKITLLLIGFSKAGGHETAAWEQHASAAFASDPLFAVYTIAVLEGVPGMFRGMAKSGIRSGTPKARRDNMVITMSGRAEWESFCGASDDKVPYLVLLDATGHARWMGHGLFDEKRFGELQAAVKDLQ